jgi:hypothetical protein
MVVERFIEIKELRQSTEPTLKSAKKELGTRRRIEKKEKAGRKILSAVRKRRSISGRIGSAIETGFKVGRKGITRTLQERDRPTIETSRARRLTPTGGIRTGKRGRPKGTVKFTDPRTGRPIGVFEHRKIMAQQRRLEVIRARGQAAVTPRQQQVLKAIEEREQRQRMSGESRIIPSTSGNFNLNSIMNDITKAANIFP